MDKAVLKFVYKFLNKPPQTYKLIYILKINKTFK